MIFNTVHKITDDLVGFAGKITESALLFARDVTQGSLKITEWTLEGLSELFFFYEDWHKGLKLAAKNVRYSADVTHGSLDLSLEATEKAFEVASRSLFHSKIFAHNFIYDNIFFSSILGSAHDNTYSLSTIQLSLRDNQKDISVAQALEQFYQSGRDKAILYIPGLFCDETIWQDMQPEDEQQEVITGISTHLAEFGYFGFFLRYNQGLHISENGQKLWKIVDELMQGLAKSEIKLDIICYSQGGLVLRSFLYLARQSGSPWLAKIGKITIISSPDGGSYLEKIGFWAGILMEHSPPLLLKLTGIIANLRSDGIKDLSHGIIREQDWQNPFHPGRYVAPTYFGELDDFDVYQFYSLVGNGENPMEDWLGDGIVEKPSLEHLSEKVFAQGADGRQRSFCLRNSNHFLIMESDFLIENLKMIYSS